MSQNCTGATRCEFASACVNNLCTRYGTVKVGTIFNITDDELYPKPSDNSTEMHRVCETFYAHPIGPPENATETDRDLWI